MALEGFKGPVIAETTHMDAHICAAWSKRGVVLPVNIQGGSFGAQADHAEL